MLYGCHKVAVNILYVNNELGMKSFATINNVLQNISCEKCKYCMECLESNGCDSRHNVFMIMCS